MIIEEETFPNEQDRGESRVEDQTPTTNDPEPARQITLHPLSAIDQSDESSLEVPNATILNSLSRTNTEPIPGEGIESVTAPNISNGVEGIPDATEPSTPDPNREARARWIRINRRFQFIMTSVAVLFSLLLFCVLIAWVLLTSTYVLSHNKVSP